MAPSPASSMARARVTSPATSWRALRTRFSEGAIIELLLLAGFYRAVSYLTNALRLPLEEGAARFPDRSLPIIGAQSSADAPGGSSWVSGNAAGN